MIQQDNGDLVFYSSKIRMASIAIFGGLPLTALGIWMFQTAEKTFHQFMGLFGAIFFGASVLVILAMMFRTRPFLTVTGEAVIFHPQMGRKSFDIPLADIEQLQIVTISNNKFVGFFVRDMERFLATKGALIGAAARWSASRGYGIGTVSRAQIGVPFDDFMKLVMARVEAARTQAL